MPWSSSLLCLELGGNPHSTALAAKPTETLPQPFSCRGFCFVDNLLGIKRWVITDFNNLL